MEKPAQHIIRNNLLALLATAVVLGLAAKFVDSTALFVFGFIYLGQALFNLIPGVAHLGRGPQGVGAAPYFLSMLLIPIISFGACSGLFVGAGHLDKC